MANRINQNTVAAFSKPAHNPAKVWTAVKKDYFFFGSFDFATFEEAKEYLVQQIGRAGYAVAHGTYFDGSAPIFRDTFIINRETFETWTLADLGLAYERSNSWSSKRNFCLTPAQHAARLERVNAYLAKRKARANKPLSFAEFVATKTHSDNLPETLGMDIEEIGFARGLVYADHWYIGETHPNHFNLILANLEWTSRETTLQGMEIRLYEEYTSNFDNVKELRATVPHFAREFPDFPIADMPAIPAGFVDHSWHNDSMPTFINETLGLFLAVDYADESKREFDETVRFSLSEYEDGIGNPIVDSDDWRDIIKAIIAYDFAAVLKSWLEPNEWNEMREINLDMNVGTIICASHDYCDANMAMQEAFERVTGKSALDSESDEDAALWSDAWQFAKDCGLIAETVGERDEKKSLAAEYVALIGYDPFADDASATIESVKQKLAEYKAERDRDDFEFGLRDLGSEPAEYSRGMSLGAKQDDDYTPIANVLECLAQELPETVTLEMLTENSDLARIILAVDDIGNRVSTATLSTLKSR